ncbi:hypothetical protein Q1695_011934 [Nippostrongylus brasiliensis]|nr:hypothetical protein Q1695_011934 [Nippostrongylus brasiliensis]
MIAVILSLAWLPIASCVCIQCASPSLANLWQITGLPRRPDSLAFHPQCSALTDMADLKLPSMGLDTCSSLCFEMVIPFANQYHYVRGCQSEFVENEVVNETTTVNTDKCYFSRVSGQVIYSNSDRKEPLEPVIAAVRFVKVSSGTDKVNIKLSETTLYSNDLETKLEEQHCAEAPKTNCVKSMYYDGTGADDKKNSCSGAYCTKVEGKLNGRKYVERGCAPISPYVTDVCFNIRSNTTFMSGPGDGGIVSRSKRSLDAILHGKECFCSSSYCNASSEQLHLSFFISILLLVTVMRFLCSC